MRRKSFFSPLLLAPLLSAGLAFAADQKSKTPATYDIPLPARPDFSALAWLIGDWAGHTTDVTTGKQTEGIVHLTLSYALDKRFLLVHEEISLPAGKSAPAGHETWTGFLGGDPSGTGFVLHSFSSTGFISRYLVTVRDDDRAVFDPEGGPNPPPGFLFRRVIARLGPGFFSEKVEVAPPGGAFFPYYSAELTQVLEPKPTAPAAPTSQPVTPARPADSPPHRH